MFISCEVGGQVAFAAPSHVRGLIGLEVAAEHGVLAVGDVMKTNLSVRHAPDSGWILRTFVGHFWGLKT